MDLNDKWNLAVAAGSDASQSPLHFQTNTSTPTRSQFLQLRGSIPNLTDYLPIVTSPGVAISMAERHFASL